MATIRFTHVYDLLHQIASMVGGFVVVVAAGIPLNRITYPIEHLLDSHGFGWLWAIISIAYFVFGYVGGIILLQRTILPYWLPTFLYVRLSLFTKISRNEAEKLGFLFNGQGNGYWYSGKSFRHVDKDYRREFLFRFANKVAGERGWRHPFEMPEDRQAQASRQWQQEQGQNTQGTPNAQTENDKLTEKCLIVLGLTTVPTDFAMVKNAYRRKIGQFHPDKFVGERPELLQYAEEMSKQLNGAYAYLEQRYAGAVT